MAEVAALVLAAGRGTRFGSGGSKVLTPLGDGRPMLAHVVDLALASRASPVLVVTGHAGGAVEMAMVAKPVSSVRNEDYMSGLASSLRVGLGALPATSEGVLVMLGDMPFVRADTLDRLISCFDPECSDAVIPIGDRQRGNPVLIGRSLFANVRALQGDEGARRLLSNPSCRVRELDVDDPGIFADVDTPAALDRWELARGLPDR